MKKFILFFILAFPFNLFSQVGNSSDDDSALLANERRKAEIATQLQTALVELREAEKKTDQTRIMNACAGLAAIFEKEQYYDKSNAYLGKAAKIALELGATNELLAFQTRIAENLLLSAKWEESHKASSELLAKHKQSNQLDLAVNDLERMAESAIQLNNHPKAREHYLEILQIGKLTGNHSVELSALNNMGFTSTRLGNHKEALHYFEQAEAVSERNAAAAPGQVFTNLGIAHHNLGNKDRSLKNLQLSESLNAESKPYIQHLISTIYLTSNDIYNALTYNKLAVAAARKSKEARVLADAYNTASEIYKQLYEYDQALEFYKKHLHLKDSLDRLELIRVKELENIHAFMEDAEASHLQNLISGELRQSNLEQAELRNQTMQLQFEADRQLLEKEKQQQQIALLEQSQRAKEASLRAAQLESERTRQELALATQRNLALAREKEIEALNQQRQLDSLELARQRDEQQQRIALMQKEQEVALKEKEQEEFRKRMYSLGTVGLAVLGLITASWLYGRRLNRKLADRNQLIESQNKEIATERNRAEGLLLNILPSAVASELKLKGAATPQHYDSATVLFTDFAGFTAIASTMHPTELVEELNECFSAFDRIAEKHHLEKIKTIGDSFMCAGGLPEANNTHPFDAVKAAKEIMAYMNDRNQRLQAIGKKTWPIRIGIHTGELVAGVVGTRKFAYDIWGDTVNVASRMESNSESGQINISEATYRLVGKHFNCKFRGEIDVKNKGKMGMYLIADHA